MDGPGTELVGYTLLQERDAVQGAVGLVHTGQEQDEYGGGTDHQGVNIDGNDLGQALFGRMGDLSGSRGVGRGTHTCFIGEEAPLDTVDHAGTGKAAENGLEIKGGTDDRGQDSGNLSYIQDDDQNAHDDIKAGHDRDQYGGKPADLFGAGKEQIQGGHEQDTADGQRDR